MAVAMDGIVPYIKLPEILAEAKEYTDDTLGTLSEGLTYKGSVASVSALPASGNVAGDAYNVTDGSGMYAWDGTSWGSASLSGPQGEQGETGPAGADGKTKDVKLNGTSVLDSNNEAQLYVDDSVTSTETTHALSAKKGKELQDQIFNLENIGRFLAIWNCATGLPLTNPTTLPYTYKTGDYYRVGTVASSSATNYKPNGATYTGAASTTVETEDVEVGWVYYYDGTNWLAQSAGGGGLVQDVQINGTTILDLNSGVANIPNSSASVSGVMTSTQYTKLDGIEAGAEVNTVDSVDGETGAVVLSDVKYTTQTLTSAQQLQARTNIGAGTPYTVTVDI